jgi:hypothetical protein
MKKKILFFISGLMLSSSVIFGQSSKIEINISSIHEEINVNDSILIKVPIKNVGNRDLIWNVTKVAPEVRFSKADYADITFTENQDRITKDIWITRANTQGIFNIAVESGYNNTSPEGTLWSFGTSNKLDPEDYTYWGEAVDWYPPDMVNNPMSLYLTAYNEKINILFKSWTQGGNGGGFSYIREGIATWLNIINNNGNVLPTKTDTLYLLLNSKTVFGGTFNADILITTNDPENSEITIPVSLKVNAEPEMEIPVNSLNFGDIYINDSASLPVVILNNGNGELIINEVEGQSENFRVSTLPVIFPAQSKSNFTINFIPKNTILYNDSLILKTNDPINPSIIIYLTGTGVQGTPQLTIDEETILFGDEYLNNKDSVIILLRNTGTDQLTITNITNNTNHYFVDKTNFYIAHGHSQNLTIFFKPELPGGIFDTLRIESNDPVNPVTEVYLSGNGINLPVLHVSTTNITDTLNAGENETRQFTITNNGTEAVNFVIYPSMPNSKVTFSKSDWADYTLPNNQDRITADVWITRANTQGIFNIAVENSYYSSSPAKTSWAWGHTYENTLTDYTIWADAIGWDPPGMVGNVLSMYLQDYFRYFDVYFSNWTQGGNGGGFTYSRIEVPSWLTTNINNYSLNAGESLVVDFTMDALDLLGGNYNTCIEIKSDYIGTVFKRINVSLKVIGEPEINTNTSLDFGNVVTKVNYTKLLEIKNDGTDTLFVNNIQITGTAFTSTDKSLYILPGKSKSISVTLNSNLSGSISETLTIFSNDVAQPQFEINLSANVIENPVTIVPTQLSYYLPSDSLLVDTIYVTNKSQKDIILINTTNFSLSQCLDSLNNLYTQITDLIPNRYNFDYDGTNYISDGGGDMYDGGNYLYTDLDIIEYSDNVIRSGENIFGTNTEYFTRHLPGLFVLLAELDSISEFYIDGELGADGNGNVDTTRFVYEKDGLVFTGLVKRVYNAGDPSVNHLIIIPNDITISHDFAWNTDNDYHVVSHIEDAPYLAYLLYASVDGSYIDSSTTLSIMKAFVDNVLYNSYSVDTIKPGITLKKEITIDTKGLRDGEYNYDISLAFKEPAPFAHKVPVSLKIENIKLLKPYSDTILNEGFIVLNIDLLNRYFSYNDLASTMVLNDNEDIATATLVDSKIQIDEKSIGTTLITVRVEDIKGNVLYSDFTLRINAIPVVANPLADVTVDAGFGSRSISLAGVFADADNESLTYNVSSSNTSVITVSVNGSEILVNEAGTGSAIVTVRASDLNGAMAEDQFNFTVNPGVSVGSTDITEIKLYPNPATEVIYLEFNNTFEGMINVEITDISGAVILSNEFSVNSGIAKINLDNLSKGVYFLRYSKGNLNGYYKIVIN